MLDDGAVHGKPTYCVGTVKNSPNFLLDQNCQCEFSCMLFLELDSMDGVWKMIC